MGDDEEEDEDEDGDVEDDEDEEEDEVREIEDHDALDNKPLVACRRKGKACRKVAWHSAAADHLV